MDQFPFYLALIVAILGLPLISDATLMEMTLYQHPNYTGNSFTLHQTLRNASCIINGVGLGMGVQSYCYTGSWTLAKSSGSVQPNPSPIRSCSRMSTGFEQLTDIYKYGPADTSTPAITLNWQGDQIRVVYESDGDLDVDVGTWTGFGVYTSGWSNWTLFSLKGFQGNTLCVGSTTTELYKRTVSRDLLPTVGSARAGCQV